MASRARSVSQAVHAKLPTVGRSYPSRLAPSLESKLGRVAALDHVTLDIDTTAAVKAVVSESDLSGARDLLFRQACLDSELCPCSRCVARR